MVMTVTQINESEIDETIFEDMFNQSLSYIDSDPPNLVWGEFDVLSTSPDEHKLMALRDYFKDTPIVYKLDIDGYIVMYGSGRREVGGAGMFCVGVDMMREDASGSNAWSYSKEFTDAVDPFYKSISDDIPETSTWVIDGSNMHTAYIESVNPNDDGDIQNSSVTNPETIADHGGYTLRKLVIIRNT
jgi:hypothetical protein